MWRLRVMETNSRIFIRTFSIRTFSRRARYFAEPVFSIKGIEARLDLFETRIRVLKIEVQKMFFLAPRLSPERHWFGHLIDPSQTKSKVVRFLAFRSLLRRFH